MKSLTVSIIFMLINSLHGDDLLKIFAKSLTSDEINSIVNNENKNFEAPYFEKKDAVKNRYIIKFKNEAGMKEVIEALPQSIAFDPTFKIHHKYVIGDLAAVAASMNIVSLNIFRQLNQVEYVQQDSILKLEDGDSRQGEGNGGRGHNYSNSRYAGGGGGGGGTDIDDILNCKNKRHGKPQKYPRCVEVIQENAGWCLSRTSNPMEIDTFRYPERAGEGENICVVDTGVNEHPDLLGRVTFGRNFVPGEANDDLNGHGTAVASGAAGTTAGVAKKAQIIAVKVLNAAGGGTIGNIVAGLMFCALEYKKSIILFAAVGLRDQFFNDAVDQAAKLGSFISGAAGNQAQDACNFSPPSSKYACTVAATTPTNELTTFTNFGICVNLTAPGMLCRMAFQADFALWSGTSMSAAYVAGWAAVVKSCTDVCGIELCRLLVKLSLKGILQGQLRMTPNRFINVDCPCKVCCPVPNQTMITKPATGQPVTDLAAYKRMMRLII